ncbi:hypothetical protein FGIG_09404 [Fasciola gigantica]|uniref:Uncharacterized protein n=1 Tax=Fasciola gigantica TaxID=46835 RepID=A0A504YXD0_FASGI|nr:hypothetical protein FGIG_09404 [Fasciola gigantica]
MCVQLVDYNDTTDTVDFSGVSDGQMHVYPMSSWQWYGIHQLQPNKSYSVGREVFKVTFVGNNTDNLFSQSGSVRVQFTGGRVQFTDREHVAGWCI